MKKVEQIKKIITDKWHFCQIDQSVYDGKLPPSIPSINELPTEEGLYLCYIWDDENQPKYYYEVLKWKNETSKAISYFLRIHASFYQTQQGKVYPAQVIKWMYYEDFLTLIEGHINYEQ